MIAFALACVPIFIYVPYVPKYQGDVYMYVPKYQGDVYIYVPKYQGDVYIKSKSIKFYSQPDYSDNKWGTPEEERQKSDLDFLIWKKTYKKKVCGMYPSHTFIRGIYIYIYTYFHISIHTYIHILRYLYTYIYTYSQMFTYLRICIYVNIYPTHIHIETYENIDTHFVCVSITIYSLI